MPDRSSRDEDLGDESAEARRERQSAREVAEWEAAFRAPRTEPRTEPVADADRANAGAVVSRAHRAEKASGHPNQTGDETW
jgi:hypothetical protein